MLDYTGETRKHEGIPVRQIPPHVRDEKKTFEKAVEILNAKHAKNARKSGRKPKLCMEDKLLATLEYLREHRTMAHIAVSYGIAESNIHATIRWVENTLVKVGFVKHFKIVSEKYRGRRRRFGLRFNLVAGICNYELSC